MLRSAIYFDYGHTEETVIGSFSVWDNKSMSVVKDKLQE